MDFTNYPHFAAQTLGHTYGQGQCWDYINLIWNHLGSKYWTYPPSDEGATNHGVKYGWLNLEARAANLITHITAVYNLTDLQLGDIVITDNGIYGHAGFLNSPYTAGQTSMVIQSQNYQGMYVTVDNINISHFLGAFRYDGWSNTPPVPVITGESHFNWVLYARKLRDKRSGM